LNQRIGFIGAGLMGSAMVRNLLAAGYDVRVHDIDAAKVDALLLAGAQRGTPLEIVRHSDVILLSLPNSDVVNDVVTNDLRLVASGRKGIVVIDTSTGEPTASRALAGRLAGQGIDLLDTTVSGTSEMCAVRDVLFMAGGRREAFEQCLPVFEALGKEALYMGESGAGAVAKLIVNLVLGLNRMALAEGLTLAGRAGLDTAQTLTVLRKSAAYSSAMDQKGERMVRSRYVPAASKLGSSYKGARLMNDLAARCDCPVPLLAFYTQALAAGVAKGRADWDNAAIACFYRDLIRQSDAQS
jgi:3-hydroxyisobutyrate dehydrogenase-like beta-hydroxyacid dehydrogenase